MKTTFNPMETPGSMKTAEDAASALEAHFLRLMLSEVKLGEGAAGGFAGSTFREMLDGCLADAMAASGQLGIAKSMLPALQTAGGSPPSATPNVSTNHSSPPLPSGHLAAPVVGPVTSRFGSRLDPFDGSRREHLGQDIAAAEGAPVHAAGVGVVKRVGRDDGYGQFVVIDHGNGLETRYAHLSEVSVDEGQRVGLGSKVGAVGATGRATGPHLHFEVRRDGTPQDPADELSPPQVLQSPVEPGRRR